MRTFLLFLLLTLLCGAAHAQDLLTKRNGDEVLVKVLEITPTEVKFRRADNPDGPLISVWTSDVFMIRYANGAKEVFGAGGSSRSIAKPAASAEPQAAAPRAVAANAPAVAAPPAPPVTASLPADAPRIPVITNRDPNDAVLGEGIQLNGPRIGVTMLSPSIVNKAHEQGTDINPFITQFGWQFENRLFRLSNGVSALVEFVPLIGGLDQGKFLPSLSGLLGIRSAKGLEFGVGPNVTPLGASVVLAMGTSIQSNGINFPINVAVVPGKDGMRVSLLLGFNARRK